MSENESKSIVLTGGSRGIGRAAAEVLLRRGHRLVLTSRSERRGADACAELSRAVPGADVTHRTLDLASPRSVRAFAAALLDERVPVDVLVHNAGMLRASRDRELTEDGVELTLATNALGPFLLTHELLPALLASDRGRVVHVSSRLHAPGSRGTEVDFRFDDPQQAGGYDPARAYKNSKLALLWINEELDRRAGRLGLPLTCVAVCPGFVPVTAAADAHGIERLLLRWVLPRMPFATSLSAAAGVVAAAVIEDGGSAVGRLRAPEGSLEMSADARSAELAERFWRLACQLVAVSDWP